MFVRIPVCSLILICVNLPGLAASAPAAAPETADRVVTTTVNYTVPNIRLVRDDGTTVSLAEEMNDGRAVVLNFIFTTCSSFCPLSSQTFAQFQRKLGADRGRVHLMSISIDPEQDTPARLRDYARKYHAGPGWQHYTGTVEASRAAQRAFGAYQGDKMSHAPLTLVRPADGKSWRRIEGFVTPDELLSEYHRVQSEPPLVGESIYRTGVLPSGQSLTATRDPDMRVEGAAAACVNCHRRSGLGELEGRIDIPPISGPYLFHPRVADAHDFNLPLVEAMRRDREPYTDSTLARAIREGIAADDRPLSYLMPHYALGDADMAALIGYLKGLTPPKSPGVTASVLHFATVITPDADPVKRRGMLDVLEQYFAEQNAISHRQSPPPESAYRLHLNPPRQWLLHVWQLSGPAGTWQGQLRRYLAQQPVLAAISGLGGKDWMPVHRFCEQSELPCLFPNVELPTVAEHDFYSVYFSRGVLLEADIIARQLTTERQLRQIVQIFRPADIGQPAARAFRATATDLRIVDRPLGDGAAGPQLSMMLRDLGARDVLILWLRPEDLRSLANLPAVKSTVVISGLMGGLGDAPLPPAWRRATQMAYPFDLPDRRRVRMDYPLGWFRLRQIPLVAEQVQADTWVACSVLAETLSHLGGALVPDYLVERMEGMLEHRILTAYYPRLSLAPDQRFASKGGYLVRFARATGSGVVADSDWIVP